MMQSTKNLTFTSELLRIDNLQIRQIVAGCLMKAPSHFRTQPATSSGRYHPPDENQHAGLMLHTKRVCATAEIIMTTRAPLVLGPDIIRGACLLHDVARYGLGEDPTPHSLDDHPELAWNWIIEQYPGSGLALGIADCVLTHMGRWGKSKPKTEPQHIVHLADMIAANLHIIVQGGE